MPKKDVNEIAFDIVRSLTDDDYQPYEETRQERGKGTRWQVERLKGLAKHAQKRYHHERKS